MNGQQQFVVRLQADGRRDDAATERKLKALLHKLGTIYGLRVVSVQQPQREVSR